MRNEKQNNSDWINKLDDPGCLAPEEMIDTNAAWQKLHERLREKPKKNKMMWYWAAAACLVIAFSVPLFILKKNEIRLVKNISPQLKNESLPTTAASPTTEKAGLKIANDLKIENKKSNLVVIKRTHHLPADAASVKQTFSDAAFESTKPTPQQTTIYTVPQLYNAPPTLAIVLPVKKKMRIVHINDLENASEEQMASSKPDQQQNTFSISFGNNNQPMKQTSPVRDYAGVFKIKISSKN